MAKEPTKTKATDKPKLAPLNAENPFVAVLHRTPSRDNLKIFTGDTHAKDAETFATQIAARNGTVFLLKPVKVFTPPKEPVVEVADLDF